MDWIYLTNIEQIEQIKLHSFNKPQLIFKHSTRCGTSSMVLNRLEKSDAPANADFYFLDLLQYRAISHAVSETFQVHHESPQMLLIKNGECIYDESHLGIRMQEIEEQISMP